MHQTVPQILLVRQIFETAIDFACVLDAIYSGISRPGIEDMFEKLAAAPTYEEFAALVAGAEGSAGLMRFMQLDLHDAVTVTMAKMARHLGASGSYAPVTILVEETPSGARVSYDTVSSALAMYPANAEAMLTAQALDAEVLTLLRHAAQQ